MTVYLTLNQAKETWTVKTLDLGCFQPHQSGNTFSDPSPSVTKMTLICTDSRTLMDWGDSNGDLKTVNLKFENAGATMREMKLEEAACVKYELRYVAATETAPAIMEADLEITAPNFIKRTA